VEHAVEQRRRQHQRVLSRAARLYGADFLRRCADVLTPGGVVCSQAGCPTLWRNDTLQRMTDRFDDVFA